MILQKSGKARIITPAPRMRNGDPTASVDVGLRSGFRADTSACAVFTARHWPLCLRHHSSPGSAFWDSV